MASEKPQIVASPNQDIEEGGFSFPVFLPDQSKFLYTYRSNNPAIRGIYVGDLDSKPEEQNRKRILETSDRFIYVPSEDSGSSYLIAMQDQNIIANRFNPETLEILNSIPLEQGVGSYWVFGFFSASDDTPIYRDIIYLEKRNRKGLQITKPVLSIRPNFLLMVDGLHTTPMNQIVMKSR